MPRGWCGSALSSARARPSPLAFALIITPAVLGAHPVPCCHSPAQIPPERQLLRIWMPQWHQKPRSAAAQLLNFPKHLCRSPREAGVCHQRLDKPAAPKSRMNFPCLRFLNSKTEFLSSSLATNSPICWRQWQWNRKTDRFVLENRETFWLN